MAITDSDNIRYVPRHIGEGKDVSAAYVIEELRRVSNTLKILMDGTEGAIVVEPWHLVGDTGEPAFQNSWANLDANRPARFYKDPYGIVHLDGLITTTGAINTVAFTLPEGYRPDHVGSNAHFGTASWGAYGELAVNINGDVKPVVGSVNWFSLAGITFRAA